MDTILWAVGHHEVRDDRAAGAHGQGRCGMRIQADERATGQARGAVPVVADRLTDVASTVVAIGVVVVSAAGLLWHAGHLYPPDAGTVPVSRAGDLANLAITAPCWSRNRRPAEVRRSVCCSGRAHCSTPSTSTRSTPSLPRSAR
jgi:hypothetical protein